MVPDSPRYTAGNRGPEPSFGGGLRVETPKHSAFAFPSQLNRGQLRREMTLNYESLRDSVKDSPKNLEKTTKTSSATSSRYKTHETSRSGSVDAEDDDIPDTQLTDLPANQQKMVLILDKMLSHRHVHESDLSEFSTVDFEILRAIVHRKYKVTLTNQDIKKIGSAVDLLNKVDELQFESKRSEENNKLVFKRALKYLINQYRKDHSKELKHLRKKEYEALICKEYFGSVPLPDTKKSKSKSKDELDGSRIKGQRKGAAKKSEPTLKQEEKIRGFVINPNTINSKYINFVFGSESFKEFFYQFIEQHFLADYGGARKHKLVKIVEHLYEKESTNGVKDAMQYIEHNAKFKIPWSDKELNVGVRSTREFIGRVQKKVEKTKASKTAADKRSKTSLRNAS